MKIPFTKYTACGNDFILIEKQDIKSFEGCLQEFATTVCNRRYHIGADGLLVSYPATNCDFVLEIYNRDGTKADMCGNGSRCALYHFKNGNVKNEFNISVWENKYFGRVNNNLVTIQFEKPPPSKKYNIPEIGDVYLSYPNVRHLVVPVDNLNNLDFEKIAPLLRYHKFFGEKGTNVDFIEISKNLIRARIFERGVEAETLCCTSGAIAIGAIAIELFNVSSPVEIEFQGGILKLETSENSVFVSGKIIKICTGEFDA